MVKVSISLPNNAQITFESEELEVLHEIVGMALRDLPRDLMQPPSSDTAVGSTEKSTGIAGTMLAAATMTAGPASPVVPVSPPATTVSQSTVKTNNVGGNATATMPSEFSSESGSANFTNFCRNAAPLGDMRRVVVAAEGASRHFGIDGVNAEELGWLFDLAGWRKPGNFTQTLRNAARSKFGWLERIPGRSGRYAATPIGLSKTFPTG
ncbi:uncharacterized protein METZ01_LOCUS38174 [marine metagenome]|uniref:Uncharacterized protein n=1 Tax=marine metagenome TaxID=408172 RepID=A0A381R1H2_9ZZZZ